MVERQDLMATLHDRVQQVEERLESACRRSGRARSEVTVVAVTKTISAETAALLPELGLLDLGENRPQELWHKAGALPASIRWHLIGHLQRNKIERTLQVTQWIHSVDSVRLLDALDQEAGKRTGARVNVLLEVNASGETSKQGFAPDEVPGLVPRIAGLKHLHLRGLMTMAAPEEDPERCRPTFVALRELRDRLRKELEAPHDLQHLSMGMSNDFELAVEEGATLVRLGTVLFAGVS